jgi:GNAT superfamily N-acetyltransferase
MQINRVAGSLRDHGFLCSMLLQGARSGHFSIPFNDPERVYQLKQQIRQDLSIQDKGQRSGVNIDVFYLGLARIGFSIVVDIESLPGEMELQAIGIDRKCRGQGFGSQILDATLSEISATAIHARCAKASSRMYEMLLHRGFVYQRDTSDGFRVLKRVTPHPMPMNPNLRRQITPVC